MIFLPSGFDEFTAKNADRLGFITNWLSERGIEHSVLNLENSKHVLITVSGGSHNPQFRRKTLLAHYDRIEGSPGANDNSSAVFQLLLLAERLLHSEYQHNVRIFLTDSEEKAHVRNQGTFKIANRFKNLGIDDDVYVFDCCGRGDCLVVSTAGASDAATSDFERAFKSLLERTKDLAQQALPNQFAALPVPYSDNAAFCASGVPAVAISVLPYDEASKLRLKSLSGEITTKTLDLRNPRMTAILPKTWQLIHSANDTADTLTETAFKLMESFLNALARH